MQKRALLYLTRKYKRTILLLILLFIISASLAIGLSVRGSIGAVVKDIQQNLGTSFVFKARMDVNDPDLFETVVSEDGPTGKAYIGPAVNQELTEKIIRIDGVRAYNAENHMTFYAGGTRLTGGLYEDSVHAGIEDPRYLENGYSSLEELQMWAGCTEVFGNTDTELFEKFRTGALTLTGGRHIKPGDTKKGLVSEQFAKENGLGLGDTVEISLNEQILKGGDLDAVVSAAELEIVGLYRINGYQQINVYTPETDIVDNWIFTDNETVESLLAKGRDLLGTGGVGRSMTFDNVTFFVSDPARLEDTMQRVRQISEIDTYYYDLSVDDTEYRATVKPLGSIKLLVTIFTLVIVLGCVMVLGIVFTMWVKSRKRELGIYLAMGIKKIVIVGQLLFEVLLVAALAFALTFAVTGSVPGAIGNGLLNRSMAEENSRPQAYSEEQMREAIFDGSVGELYTLQTGYTGPEKIDFVFRPMDWLLLALLEILIILGAICKAGTFLFKLQPKQILSDMS